EKSTTRVHAYQLKDAAIQASVIEGAGYTVNQASILHIDTSFIYAGDGNYRSLFTEVDVTQNVEALKPNVPQWLLRAQVLLAGPPPKVDVGKQCNDPFTCPFLAHCDCDAPEFPLSIFSSNRRARDQPLAQGY